MALCYNYLRILVKLLNLLSEKAYTTSTATHIFSFFGPNILLHILAADTLF